VGMNQLDGKKRGSAKRRRQVKVRDGRERVVAIEKKTIMGHIRGGVSRIANQLPLRKI